ncbi:hypothetical protein OIDMADRAFT_51399 [Oidiodendron maius Zn]|uniref:Uncharacterized protein n=1 Tax=Oidiodendron maius (strain Zn) TaxID=913774 RepID=A0A0C3H5H9_OIDMZ|nr:hypothetical protein OIDMADRAFT_51399 [Oidiodendron maius Zn]
MIYLPYDENGVGFKQWRSFMLGSLYPQSNDTIAAKFIASYNFIEISSDSGSNDNDDSNDTEFVNMNALIAQSQVPNSSIQRTIQRTTNDPINRDNTSDSEEFIDIGILIVHIQA